MSPGDLVGSAHIQRGPKNVDVFLERKITMLKLQCTICADNERCTRVAFDGERLSNADISYSVYTFGGYLFEFGGDEKKGR